MAEEKAFAFLRTRRTGSDITAKIKKQITDEQIRTRNGFLSIIDVIISLGQRGISLRGNWDKR